VDQLVNQACVSVRQLERQFNERIGMPPKQFTRLVRFAKAWSMRERHPHLSWLQIAYACGFVD
jgi:transcriptional regulator GlxA family with amidase domain